MPVKVLLSFDRNSFFATSHINIQHAYLVGGSIILQRKVFSSVAGQKNQLYVVTRENRNRSVPLSITGVRC